jgi:protein TonB
MFADRVLETSWAQRSRRNWTTLTSFGVQVVAIGILLVSPLLRPVGLPSARTVSTPISIGRPEPMQIVHSGEPSMAATHSELARFVAPGRTPPTIATGADNTAPQTSSGTGIGIGTGLPSGAETGLPVSIFSGTRPVLPNLPPAPAAHVFRRSNVLEGSLIRKVTPTYPPLARAARIQGEVVLFAVIGKAGTIDNLRVVSGHPILVPAAIDAVRQWRYRPYILNSEPIEVETQITVNFVLGGN